MRYVIPLLLILALGGATALGSMTAPALDPAANEPEAPRAEALPATGTLHLRIHNAADAKPVELRVEDADRGILFEDVVMLPEKDTYEKALQVPVGTVKAKLWSEGVTGWGTLNLSDCDDATGVIPMRTRFTTLGASIKVDEPGCLTAEPAPEGARTERFGGTEHIGLGATAPFPTCPTSCTITYVLDGTGNVKFPVEEGADRIEARATWDASTPATEELRVMLAKRTTEWEGCDDPDAWCGEILAGDTGASGLTIALDNPEAGEYAVGASPNGPVGVAVHQDVKFEVLVHYIG